jgi:hypothetical protein
MFSAIEYELLLHKILFLRDDNKLQLSSTFIRVILSTIRKFKNTDCPQTLIAFISYAIYHFKDTQQKLLTPQKVLSYTTYIAENFITTDLKKRWGIIK